MTELSVHQFVQEPCYIYNRVQEYAHLKKGGQYPTKSKGTILLNPIRKHNMNCMFFQMLFEEKVSYR